MFGEFRGRLPICPGRPRNQQPRLPFLVGDDVPLGGGIGLGLRESDTELKAKFDAAIQSMKDDGSLNKLIIKWFGEDANTF